MGKPTRRKVWQNRTTAAVFLGILVLSALSAAGLQNANAISAVAFTDRATITSDSTSTFRGVYHDSGGTALYFLDVDGSGRINTDKVNTSTWATSSFSNPVQTTITRQNPSDVDSPSYSLYATGLATSTTSDGLYGGSNTIAGEKVVSIYSKLNNVRTFSLCVVLSKFGSPTGDITFGVFDGSSNSGTTLHTFGTLPTSALTGSLTEFCVAGAPYTMKVNDVAGIKYTGGDATNYVTYGVDTGNPYDFQDSALAKFTGSSWQVLTGEDAGLALRNGQITIMWPTYIPANSGLGSAYYTKIAERITTSSSIIGTGTPTYVGGLGVILSKTGAPTGTATLGVWNATGALIKSFGTLDVSTLTGTATEYSVNVVIPNEILLSPNYYFGIEYTGGDASNFVKVHESTDNRFDGTGSHYARWTGGGWDNTITGIDAAVLIKIKSTYPDYANDDNLRTWWVNTSDFEAGANIYAELGSAKKITEVQLYHQNPKTTPGSIDMYVSNSTGSWGSVRKTFIIPETYELRAYYPFEGTSTDASESGNNGALSGSPTTVDGKYHSGLSFPSGSAMTVTDTASLNPSTWTISLWVKKTSEPANFDNIVSKVDGGNHGWQILYAQTAPRQPYLSIHNSLGNEATNSASCNTSLSTGFWRHLAWSFDGTNLRTYENGALLCIQPITGTYQVPTGGNMAFASTGTFTQVIDEFKMYGRVLSQAEIQETMKQTDRMYSFTLNTPVVGRYVKMQVNAYDDVKRWGVSEFDVKTIEDSESNVQVSDVNTFKGYYGASRDSTDTLIQSNPDAGLVAYYPLETDAHDQSGKGNHAGTYASSPTFGAGTKGNAANLVRASGQFFLAPNDSTLAVDKVTMTGWIKVTDTSQTGQHILRFANGGAGLYAVRVENTKLQAFVRDSANNLVFAQGTSSSALSNNVWYFVAATFDGNNLNVYLNGALYDTVAGNGLTLGTTSTGSLCIGCNPNITEDGATAGTYFGGSLDDLRVYNRPLSLLEIQNLYKSNINEINGYSLYNDNLKMWINFDDNTVNDKSGNGNNGSVTIAGSVSPPVYVQGKHGQGFRADGSAGTYINIPITSSLQANQFSVAFWVKRTGLNIQFAHALSHYNGGTNDWACDNPATSGDQIRCGIDNSAGGGFSANGVTLPLNTWAHIAMTFDGSNIRFYKDGALQQTIPFSGTFSSTGAVPIRIGSAAAFAGNFWQGDFDDVRYYSTALSTTEVNNLYSSNVGALQVSSLLTPLGGMVQSTSNIYVPMVDATGNGKLYLSKTPKDFGSRSDDGLVAHWKFDEGSGTLTADSSGNGNTGTLTNGATWFAGDTPKGKAVDTDGTNDYINVPASPVFKIQNELTLSAWVKPDQIQASVHGDILRQGNEYWFRVNGQNEGGFWAGFVKIGGSVEPRVSSASPADVTKWTMLTMTYDGANLKLYVNGVLSGTQARTGYIEMSNNPFTIGGEPTNVEQYDGKIADGRVYNRALSADEIKALYYGEFLQYTGTASVPVLTTIPAKSVVVSDGASEVVYTFFASSSTSIRAVKFATATQTATLLSTAMTGEAAMTDYRVIPLNGKIIVTTDEHVWELNTSTDAITQLLTESHSHEAGVIPDDTNVWISYMPQTFTISTSSRSYVDTNLPYLASRWEAHSFTPSTGAGPTDAAVPVQEADRGLDTGSLILHGPPKYYYLTGLSLTIDAASSSGTTWTVKSVGSGSSITNDAHHEFLQSIEPDPFGPYEFVHYIYCDFLNWNMSAPVIQVAEYDDCTEWHTFSEEDDPTADPHPRRLFPFTPEASPVHAFSYDRYTFDLTVNDDPTDYKITTGFKGIDVDMEMFDSDGIAQQRWLNGNCYDLEIKNLESEQVVLVGNVCANGVTTKTINLSQVNIPDDWLGAQWFWNMTRDYTNSTANSLRFDIKKSETPFNVTVFFKNHFDDKYVTYQKNFTFTNQDGLVTIVLNDINSNMTIYADAFENGQRVVNDVSGAVFVALRNPFTPLGDFFGIPAASTAAALIIVMLAAAWTKSNAHFGIVVMAAAAGFLIVFQLLTIPPAWWGILMVVVAIGVVVGKKYL